LVFSLIGTVSFFAVSARADFIAADLPRNTVGNQGGNSASNYVLGEDFTVPAAGITVTNLAAFDPYITANGANAPLGTGSYDSIPVSIYYVNVTGHTAGTLVPNLSTAVGSGANAQTSGGINTLNGSFVSANSAFLKLNTFTPVILPAGTYRVVAANYTNEMEDNAGNVGAIAPTSYSGSLISFPGDNTNGFNNFPGNPSTVDAYPTGTDGGPMNRYGAGTFLFDVAPEPGSLSVLALAGMSLLIRRSRAGV
jgi:hypothetical protein